MCYLKTGILALSIGSELLVQVGRLVIFTNLDSPRLMNEPWDMHNSALSLRIALVYNYSGLAALIKVPE